MSDLIWMRVHEAARYTGLSVSTLNKLRCWGGSARYVKRGKTILYQRQWLDEWLIARSVTSTSEYGKLAKSAHGAV